MAKVVEV
jgi:hypothetical protein